MKTVPWLVRVYRELMLFVYIARVVWQYNNGHNYPLISLPDWAVHYMARYLYDDNRGGCDEMFLEDIITLSQEEWELRHRKRKESRH
jgi:hypothetical protein